MYFVNVSMLFLVIVECRKFLLLVVIGSLKCNWILFLNFDVRCAGFRWVLEKYSLCCCKDYKVQAIFIQFLDLSLVLKELFYGSRHHSITFFIFLKQSIIQLHVRCSFPLMIICFG